MKLSKIVLFAFLLFVGFSYGQNILIGKVSNSKNKPVVNAKVFLDSIYTNVETNKNGDFEILLPEKVTMVHVYSDDYGLLSSKFNNENIMNFMFLDSDKSIKGQTKKGDKITIGYSEVDKKYKVNNSVAISIPTDKNAAVYNTIYDMIRGRLSGVTVSRDNRITIRGVSSIRNISEPLFVVDGMIVSSIDYISPNNVKNISVLKGAEASVYGSQASAGVILIKTK
ncbi:TonB-dependent receptor plug domain-containing protein [Flavobacterium sp. LB1P62]|uniref:TonB-dependent receptor plug domain-containing protein n=1 Tax=unclassified Flavobacterium TaxID=196869 RepID=UPI003AAEE5EF